jgi:Ca2+-binding RTX toxin-like protein
MFETLEPRRLFTVTVLDDHQGKLLITGTEEYDSLFLSLDGSTATVNGVVYESITAISYESGGGDDYTVVSTGAEGSDIAVRVDGGDGNDTIDASDSITPIDFSGGAGDDVLIGSSSSDTLSGGDGNDVLLGMSGTDAIVTGGGNDYINGGGQMDLINPADDGENYAVSVVETYPGMYEITGDYHNDVVDIRVSMAQSTFSLGSNTYGNVSALTVKTNGGSDNVRVYTIDGPGSISAAIELGIGNDIGSLNFDGGIWGGAGLDSITMTDAFRGVIEGNDGNDTIKVIGISQEMYVLGNDGDDIIDCSLNSYGVRANGGGGNDTIIGSPAPDELFADDGDDKVYGLGGADMIDAGSGIDYLDGGNGNDIFLVDSNWTVIGGLGIDTVYAYVINGTHSGVERVLQR